MLSAAGLLDAVARVRAAERDRTPDSTAVTEAVARYLYKLQEAEDRARPVVRPGVPGAACAPATATLAVRLAELPDVVRGYEDVKLRKVESCHQSLAELRPA